MAQYKVPQDVEADDKLLGPFNFRQFVYLLIAAGLGFLAYGLAQIFPLLALIPVPFIIFLLLLALPLKKDQPMETYLAALTNFYLKPRKRFWNPGQRESTIAITAPKKVEANRVRDISGYEASHRLSFLSNIVDSEGRSIKNAANAPMREDFLTEANSATDMFDTYAADNLDRVIRDEAANRHNRLVTQMRASFEKDRAEAAAAAPQYATNNIIRHSSSETSSSIVQPQVIPTTTPTPEPTHAPEPTTTPTLSESITPPSTTPPPSRQDTAIPLASNHSSEDVFISLR